MRIMPHDMPETVWPRVAKRHGIRYGTYYRRVKVYGWSKRDAATTPPRHAGTRQVDSESTRQKLIAHGLDHRTVRRHRKLCPDSTLTDDEVIAAAVARRNKQTLADKARARGMNPNTVRRRVNKLGWPVDKALDTPAMTPQEARAMRRTKGWAS